MSRREWAEDTGSGRGSGRAPEEGTGCRLWKGGPYWGRMDGGGEVTTSLGHVRGSEVCLESWEEPLRVLKKRRG